MTKNRKKQNNQRASLSRKGVVSFANTGARTVYMPFRVYYSQGTGSSSALQVTEIGLSIANLGSRIVDAGDIFTQFRIRSLSLESFLMNNSTTAFNDTGCIHGVAVTGTNPVNYVTPSALTQLCDLPAFAVGPIGRTVRLGVPSSELTGMQPLKWYNTSSAGSTELSVAGVATFFCQSQSTLTYNQSVFLTGMIEFRGPIDPADVPLDRLKRRISKDMDLLRRRENSDDKESKDWSVLHHHSFSQIAEEDWNLAAFAEPPVIISSSTSDSRKSTIGSRTPSISSHEEKVQVHSFSKPVLKREESGMARK